MLEFKNVGYRIGHREILSDVSFPLRAGRVTAIIGHNGSGKTSLFRAVNREIPYDGEILIAGRVTTELSPMERARRVAILPQVLPTPPLTVRELAALGRTPHQSLLSRPSAADREAVERALACCDLAPLAERRLEGLSGGERQRAYLSMLLATEAPLLLLDEPTTYLDADARRGILSLLCRLSREEGRGVAVVLHELNDAIRYADDIALLAAGQLVFYGTVTQFLATDLAERHFGLTRHAVGGDLPFFY